MTKAHADIIYNTPVLNKILDKAFLNSITRFHQNMIEENERLSVIFMEYCGAGITYNISFYL